MEAALWLTVGMIALGPLIGSWQAQRWARNEGFALKGSRPDAGYAAVTSMNAAPGTE